MRLFISVQKARELLPEVGDRLERIPSMYKDHTKYKPAPRPCTVVEVNAKHLWYRVLFDNGTTECYKVPEGEELNQ